VILVVNMNFMNDVYTLDLAVFVAIIALTYLLFLISTLFPLFTYLILVSTALTTGLPATESTLLVCCVWCCTSLGLGFRLILQFMCIPNRFVS
jgi:hypothetical protein